MNRYLLCNKMTGKVVCEKYGDDLQFSDDGLHDFITDGMDGDSRILWCWSHDSYLVGVEYDIVLPEVKEQIIFSKR